MSAPSEQASDGQASELRRAVSAGELDAAALIDRLAAADWVARRALVVVLAELGDSATPALLQALETRRDDEARIAALVDALSASSGHVDADVSALAEHPDPAIVADVAQILGRRRSSQAVATLVRLTKHSDDNVAVGAIEGLGRIGGQSAVEALVACVEGNSFFRTFPAIDVLGRSGDPRAIAPLARLLSNPRYAFEAARALGRSADRAAVAPLIKLASVGSEASVRVACLALSELCERHAERYGVPTAIEALLREARSEALLRRLGQSLARADKAEKIATCRVLGALRDGAALPWLLPLLDADAETARAASRALEDIGKDTDLAIDRALIEPHSARRAVLLPAILRADHAAAVLVCLDDPEPQVRALAAEALGRLGHTQATRPLFALLADESARVVLAASSAIQALGSDETEALALTAARSEQPHVKRAALRILAYFGYEGAYDTFMAALGDSDPRLRDAAVQGLSLLQQPAAQAALLATAGSDDEKARAAAMRALGQAESSPAILACLTTGLSDPDAWVRYYACQAIGRQRATALVEAVARLLGDEAGQVRVAAVEALSHLSSPLAVTALQKAAHAQDLDVRRAALLGLGLVDDQSSLPLLLEAVSARDAPTRLVALSALARSRSPDVTEALARAARDADEAVRTAAIGFLLAVPTAAASEVLIALVADDVERARALEALSTPSTPLSIRIDTLVRALDQADDELSSLLISCLSRLERKAPSDGLYRALASPNRRARIAAAHGLSALGTHEAFAALSRAASADPDSEVRRVCALHLAG
ncbi:MAG: hypothetical protein JWN48_5450 [Myxococcaceae bacterium]|nr:hypothetical protein [Myxococcaceae bacterium]